MIDLKRGYLPGPLFFIDIVNINLYIKICISYDLK